MSKSSFEMSARLWDFTSRMSPQEHMVEDAVAKVMQQTGMQYIQALRHVQQQISMQRMPQPARRIG